MQRKMNELYNGFKGFICVTTGVICIGLTGGLETGSLNLQEYLLYLIVCLLVCKILISITTVGLHRLNKHIKKQDCINNMRNLKIK